MTGVNQEFQGPVEGGVAGRDVVNHNYQSESRLLTDAEVWPIKQKALRLIELTNKPDVEIWGQLKSILGCGLRELRQDNEKPAHAILDLWLSLAQGQGEANAGQQAELLIQVSGLKARLSESLSAAAEFQRRLNKSSADLKAALAYKQEMEQQLRNALSQVELLRIAKPPRPLCQTCATASTSLARIRRKLVVISGIAIIVTLATLFLGYQANAALDAAAAEARLQVCEHDGKAYRLGSVVDNSKAPDLRCVVDAPGQAAHWQEIPVPKQGNAKSANRPQRAKAAPKHKKDGSQGPAQEKPAVTSNADLKELLF